MSYAKEGEVVAGDKLVADGGFTCLTTGETHTVLKDERGDLYVPCAEGRHYIDGQLEDGREYIGFTRA